MEEGELADGARAGASVHRRKNAIHRPSFGTDTCPLSVVPACRMAGPLDTSAFSTHLRAAHPFRSHIQ
jgi:hypothetical protein